MFDPRALEHMELLVHDDAGPRFVVVPSRSAPAIFLDHPVDLDFARNCLWHLADFGLGLRIDRWLGTERRSTRF